MRSRRVFAHRGRGLAALAGAAGLGLVGILPIGVAAAANPPSGCRVSRISVGSGTGVTSADAVAADPNTGKAYVAVSNNGGGAVAVVNAATNTVSGSVSLGRYYATNVAVNPQTDM